MLIDIYLLERYKGKIRISHFAYFCEKIKKVIIIIIKHVYIGTFHFAIYMLP